MSKVSPIWHPFTQHKTFGPAIEIERAEGACLYTRTGKKILDGISSWWVNTHGHCHPRIVEAVQRQAGRLDQVIFAGFTHEPAERLSRKLLKRAQSSLGPGLDFVFFSDSGSTAVEVALKMAIGHFAHTGQKRRKIVALEGGYHGDTFGTMSAGGRGVYNAPYAPYLFDVHHVPFPHKGEEAKTVQAMERWLRQYGSEAAAFIFEPLVQGAAGMRAYSPDILKTLTKLCREHGVLLIADEVMTGFGRTGTFFACEQAGVIPDLLCLSKGLTGGYLPMGATLSTRQIYKSFYHQDKTRQFFHSSSFTGNAMACAAALASLEIWEEEPVLERVAAIEAAHQRASGWFVARPDIADVRVVGSIMALDVLGDVTEGVGGSGYESVVGSRLYDLMMENGVLLRPLGNTVYILPPYCINESELEQIYETLWRSLDRLRDEGFQQAA
ncbi:MAG: adenosylmethionine--8-amino-7-oxononanoate transaminase [Alphaproteobacteria bacterium]|nr:adenosylmethionine--8-amino-7-oxononanoate transaminase [Alphaproteobacteria bacterium]